MVVCGGLWWLDGRKSGFDGGFASKNRHETTIKLHIDIAIQSCSKVYLRSQRTCVSLKPFYIFSGF